MSSDSGSDRQPAPTWTRETLAAQAMQHVDPVTRAVVPPLHLSTTFHREPDNTYPAGFIYARPDNQTVREAESVLAMLEAADAGALLFGSGMAAATAIFRALDPGDHVVCSRVMYWALRNWLNGEATRWGLHVEFVDTSDLEALRAAIKPGKTKLVHLETPGNPLWSIADIAAAAGIAHQAGARLSVDSTAASPYHTQPLALGADVVMHAATKILNGHTDVVAGMLAARTDDEFWTRIKQVRTSGGAIVGPFEAYLLTRGLRTFFLRARQQAATAQTLAEKLAAHPKVAEVLYPGLPTHPGHAIAARQMVNGFGYMMSIRVAAGDRSGEANAIETAARVTLWHRATSLGGVESLIEHRSSVEGPGTLAPTDLLRMSIGIEDANDLYADLDNALSFAK
jgi:cystathionine gamma-synthase